MVYKNIIQLVFVNTQLKSLARCQRQAYQYGQRQIASRQARFAMVIV